jgi:hypothetical protein
MSNKKSLTCTLNKIEEVVKTERILWFSFPVFNVIERNWNAKHNDLLFFCLTKWGTDDIIYSRHIMTRITINLRYLSIERFGNVSIQIFIRSRYMCVND